jgi:hypothetical protein
MRSGSDVARVRELANHGLNDSQISRLTGVSRNAIRNWLRPDSPRRDEPMCELCSHEAHNFGRLAEREYSYLFGIYLGDGSIARFPRCYALRVSMDSRYPVVIREVADAMRAVMPQSLAGVYTHPRHNVVLIVSYSKAWPCLLPQHGPGRKHERRIELVDWQQAIVNHEPEQFIRGLIHSDGCRTMNRVVAGGNDYAYPRYVFSQVSKDIQDLFCQSLERLGIDYGFSSRGKHVSIHRRESVARLDAFVAPKR